MGCADGKHVGLDRLRGAFTARSPVSRRKDVVHQGAKFFLRFADVPLPRPPYNGRMIELSRSAPSSRRLYLRRQYGRDFAFARARARRSRFRQTNRTILLRIEKGGDPTPPFLANNSVARRRGDPSQFSERFEWELWREGARNFRKTTVRGFLFAGNGLRHFPSMAYAANPDCRRCAPGGRVATGTSMIVILRKVRQMRPDVEQAVIG
jgi:hypothetical protein